MNGTHIRHPNERNAQQTKPKQNLNKAPDLRIQAVQRKYPHKPKPKREIQMPYSQPKDKWKQLMPTY